MLSHKVYRLQGGFADDDNVIDEIVIPGLVLWLGGHKADIVD